MIYLASPFAHEDPLIKKTRFLLAEQATANLLRQDFIVFSPIVHCYKMAINHQLPTDHDFWMNIDLNILRHAHELFVLDIDGWRRSKGVRMEIDFAKSVNMPITMTDPEGHLSKYKGD